MRNNIAGRPDKKVEPTQTKCPDCGGYGMKELKECKRCNGSGQIPDTKK
jgi:DnaJ-class molecular chaperone